VTALIAQECGEKFGGPVAIDAGGRTRTMSQIMEAMALAKEAGVDLDKAAQIANFAPERGSL